MFTLGYLRQKHQNSLKSSSEIKILTITGSKLEDRAQAHGLQQVQENVACANVQEALLCSLAEVEWEPGLPVLTRNSACQALAVTYWTTFFILSNVPGDSVHSSRSLKELTTLWEHSRLRMWADHIITVDLSLCVSSCNSLSRQRSKALFTVAFWIVGKRIGASPCFQNIETSLIILCILKPVVVLQRGACTSSNIGCVFSVIITELFLKEDIEAVFLESHDEGNRDAISELV